MKSKFLLSSLIATLMPFFVFIAFAIFSVSGWLLDAWIGKKKVPFLGLGLTTLAVGVPYLKIRNSTGDLYWGPVEFCRS